MTRDEKIAEAARLVEAAYADARESGNPYAEAMVTQQLAEAGLIRLDFARRVVEGIR